MEIERTDIRKFRKDLQLYLKKRVSNDIDIEDIIQDSFVKYLSYSQLESIRSPQYYLFRIARNLLVDRSRRRTPLTGAIWIEDHPWVGLEPLQEDGRHLADLECAYNQALAELPTRCREVFMLRRHDELATADIAQRFSISHRMVQKYMARATAHLHDRLRPFLAALH